MTKETTTNGTRKLGLDMSVRGYINCLFHKGVGASIYDIQNKQKMTIGQKDGGLVFSSWEEYGQ